MSSNDSEIGLYKQGLRFYDPKLGRWTQKDPLDQVTEPRQSNRYASAGQDAVNLTDPSEASIFDDVGDGIEDIGEEISNASFTPEEIGGIFVGYAASAGLCKAAAPLAAGWPRWSSRSS